MFRPILTLMAILLAFGVNSVSNLRPLRGQTIGDISNTTFAEVLITPANYAFAIWGLIYIGLLVLGIYQLLPAQRHQPLLDRVGYALVAASLAQTAWIVCFQMGWYWASVGAMALILTPLAVAYVRVPTAGTPRQRWCVHRPLSLYLAWISVALITNVALALFASNWDGWGIAPAVWTVMLLGVAAVLAGVMALRHQDWVFTGVYLWALVAIAVRNQGLITYAALGFGSAIALFHWACGLRHSSRGAHG